MLWLLPVALLAGCEEGKRDTVEDFKQRWHAAVNSQQPEQLYDMLDAKSQRHIDLSLETLRGFDAGQQIAVINHLGGERVKDLTEMTPAQFFGLWWNRVMRGRPPGMTIEEPKAQQAVMVLKVEGKEQKIAVSVEAGQWVWRLPEQNFDFQAASSRDAEAGKIGKAGAVNTPQASSSDKPNPKLGGGQGEKDGKAGSPQAGPSAGGVDRRVVEDKDPRPSLRDQPAPQPIETDPGKVGD